jgi:hypothetical protein
VVAVKKGKAKLSEGEEFQLRWLRNELKSAQVSLKSFGYYQMKDQTLTDLIKNEGPRVNQLIGAMQLGQAYERQRIVQFLLKGLQRVEPFEVEIALEKWRRYGRPDQ